jgi:hypothetical protein
MTMESSTGDGMNPFYINNKNESLYTIMILGSLINISF